MHRTFGYLSKRLIQIRSGEGRKVLLTFFFFFLAIAAYYIVKPVSRSLLLGVGSRTVPYVDLIGALMMGPVLAIFARLADRVPKPWLVSCVFWAMTGIFLLFWHLLRHPSAWIVGAFSVWVALFSVLIVTLFWLIANDLYRPRDIGRLFSVIGSGGILGGIAGSAIAAVGAQLLGTDRLLLLSAGVLVCSWWVGCRLWRFMPPRQTASAAAAEGQGALPPNGSASSRFVTLLLQSRYLLLLVALVGLGKIVSTLVSYQSNAWIEQMFPDQDARTTFAGLLFGGMNVAAFITQFFFTSWALRRLGLFVALCMLPLGVWGGMLGLLCASSSWVAVSTELYDGSLNYSIYQTAKEVLYLPIDRPIRDTVKPFIDIVVFRCGKGIAAVIGIVVFQVLQASAQSLSYVVLPLLAAWLFVMLWLRREYVAIIRTTLQARATSRRTASSAGQAAAGSGVEEFSAPLSSGTITSDAPPGLRRSLGGRDDASPFGNLTDGRPSVRKLDLIGRLLDTRTGVFPGVAKELVGALTAYETHAALPAELAQEPSGLKLTISDRHASMAKRRQAVRCFGRLANQESVDYLFGLVMAEEDAGLRQEAVRSLVKLRVSGRRLDVPKPLIRRQVIYEVGNYRRLALVATIYHQHRLKSGSELTDDPAMALLRVLVEESLEQVFRLLMLLYRPAEVHLIYEQLRSPDPHLQADALELLDHLVEPSIRAALFPILHEDRFPESLESSRRPACEPTLAYRFLQEAIWDRNYWLSVTTLCAIGRWRLSAMYQELEPASHHPTPMIATAAKVALHLSSST